MSTLTTKPAALDDENTSHLPGLTAECERLGLTLQLTDDPALNMPEIKTIDGRRTLLARTDEIGVAYDDVHAVGRCIDCGSGLDDTAVTYFDGYTDITGAPVKICVSCQTGRQTLAADPQNVTFNQALDAIDAALKASKNSEQTRAALLNAVNLYAAETPTPAGGAR